MANKFVVIGFVILGWYACTDRGPVHSENGPGTKPAVKTSTPLSRRTDSLLKEVPVLCYHRIVASGKPSDYTISVEEFSAHIKMLADSGYTSVLPDQLLNYLTTGAPLPPKPVMISFDDTRAEHFAVAEPVLSKYGFKGVYFIMTVAIGKPGYMNAAQIKTLADSGNTIGSHTYDHQDMRKVIKPEDWDKQLDRSLLQLEKITGRKPDVFAYPFGLWNDAAAGELKKRGVKAAFQLTQKKSPSSPLYTIRRLLVTGYWNAKTLSAYMRGSFH